AQSGKPGQVLKVHFAVILAPPSPLFRMWSGIEKRTVGVVPEFGNGMEIQGDDFIDVLLLGKVAIHAVIPNRAGEAMALSVELLVKIHACLFLSCLLLSVP